MYQKKKEKKCAVFVDTKHVHSVWCEMKKENKAQSGLRGDHSSGVRTGLASDGPRAGPFVHITFSWNRAEFIRLRVICALAS